jgi:hypothetical protein
LKNSKLKPLYSCEIPKFQAQNSLPLSKSTLKTLGVELETLVVVFYHIKNARAAHALAFKI